MAEANPFSDLIPSGSSAANPFADLIPQEKKPETSVLQRIAIDFNNQQSAAGQRTTPNTSAYKNLISDQVYENDAGQALYLDPKTKELVPTDSKNQVILTDPADNKLKVYGRSEGTDEGVLSAAGRMLGTGLASGAPTSRAGQVMAPIAEAAQELKPGQQVVAAAERLSQGGSPVQVPRAVTSDNMAVQQAGKVAANVPYAGTPLVKAAEKTIDQLGTKADEIAKGYGSSASVAEAGDTARDSIKNWVTGESAKNADRLYSKVDSLVNPDIKTPLDATRSAVAEIAAKRSAAGLSAGKATESVLEAVQRPEGLTYEGVKTLRTTIGEDLKRGILPEGVSGGELKQIYGSLTKDLEASVAASGPEAAAAFQRANKYYELISDRRTALAKIIGSDGNASAETVFNRIGSMAGSTSRADIEKLAQARKAIGPEAWNEIASSVVTNLGRNVEGGFSPERFVTAWGKISPAGKSMLFRSTGKSDLANHLDDIAKVSSRFKELQKFANPSGSGRQIAGASIGTGAIVSPLLALKSVLGGYALASYLAKPASAASIAKWTRANEALVMSPSPARVSALNSASRNLISTVGAKNLTPADFLKALQGPVSSRAQDEQK